MAAEINICPAQRTSGALTLKRVMLKALYYVGILGFRDVTQIATSHKVAERVEGHGRCSRR
jgi:hypothetical protein